MDQEERTLCVLALKQRIAPQLREMRDSLENGGLAEISAFLQGPHGSAFADIQPDVAQTIAEIAALIPANPDLLELGHAPLLQVKRHLQRTGICLDRLRKVIDAKMDAHGYKMAYETGRYDVPPSDGAMQEWNEIKCSASVEIAALAGLKETFGKLGELYAPVRMR